MSSGLTYSMTSKLVLLSVTENIVYNNCGLVNSNIFEAKFASYYLLSTNPTCFDNHFPSVLALFWFRGVFLLGHVFTSHRGGVYCSFIADLEIPETCLIHKRRPHFIQT